MRGESLIYVSGAKWVWVDLEPSYVGVVGCVMSNMGWNRDDQCKSGLGVG